MVKAFRELTDKGQTVMSKNTRYPIESVCKEWQLESS